MAQKTKESAEEIVEEALNVASLPKVKQVIRYISKQGQFGVGYHPAEAIDVYLSELYDAGYQLHSTHYLGDNPEGFGVLYILHRV